MSAAPWETIPELVADAARRFSEVPALVAAETRWTFAELREQVHAAARALLASGVEPGDRVGVWAPNIPEWVVVALAIYSVGGVLVPVNTRFKAREAAFVLDRSKARRVFTVTDFLGTDYVELLRDDAAADLDDVVVLRGHVPEGAVSFADFLARGRGVDDAVRAARAEAVGPNDVCHILFTSGTTGVPKGVVLEHGQICSVYLVWAQVVDLRERDRYLMVNPFFHSFGLHTGILCCLMTGATMLPMITFDPVAAMQLVSDERVTFFPGPPTVYQTILNHSDSEAFDLSSLRVAMVGAAVVPVSLIEEMRTRLAMTVVTGYGLTEASGLVTMCHHDDPPETIAGTVGRPIPGVQLRVVDDAGADLEPGEPGEVVVSGYNVMRGYLDDPEQTAAVIGPGGWLHTGDIGYLRPDGNLVITDRKKDMFIVGGFNAYPAEIEQAMLRHPDIAQVAVVGAPDERLGEVGVAFVVSRHGSKPDAEAVIEWCRREFANYKVPRTVEFVDELPVNATGKVLKYELRERARAKP